MKNKQDSLIQYIRQIPLGTKILLLIIVCLTFGFGSYVMYSLNSETAALKHQHRLRSHLFSETLISGIRNIMLSGRTPYIRAFISEAREEFNEVGEFRLFNNKSEEIFPQYHFLRQKSPKNILFFRRTKKLIFKKGFGRFYLNDIAKTHFP